MTVSSTTNRKEYAGNGATTSFSTNPVVFFDDADLTVYVVNDTTGAVETLVLDTDYTVSGGDGTTGTVDTSAGSSPYGAPATGTTLAIVRDLAITQESNFVNNDSSDAEVAEDAIDRLTMIAQQLDARIDRSFVLPDSDTSGASTEIPAPTASSLIGWDGTGLVLQNYTTDDLDTALTTAFTRTLLDDADAATARTTLGAQASDADLTAIAALSHTAGYTIRSNGSAWTADQGLMPNLLINPNWQIDQINEGALYTVNTTDVRGPDGWTGDAVGAGVFKVRTLADPDNAALKCLEISCTTADAAIGATDRYEIWTAVEGYDAAALLLGTSSAAPFTYQFGLKSNAVTGVFGVYFTNSAGNRFYAGTITVADTSAHEYSVPITGDLAGTWLYTNGIGLKMGLVLAAGSNFQGTAGAWTASTVHTTASQANFMSANTNIIYLKRGDLHLGALVQAYKPADIQRELAKAQRQYEKSYDQSVAVGAVSTSNVVHSFTIDNTSLYAAGQTNFCISKRASPTVVQYSPNTGASGKVRNQTAGADATPAVTFSGTGGFSWNAPGALGGANNDITWHFTANARLS